MNPQPEPRWESLVQQMARQLSYPPTPAIASQIATRLPASRRPAVRRFQPAWVWVILVTLLIALLAVPPVRAKVLEFLQIGAVRIWLVEPTPTALSPTVTPRPTPTLSASLLDLGGETTLAHARQQLPFPIQLPSYPADLGLPDHVFVQDLMGSAVVLVWVTPGSTSQVRLSLHILTSAVIVQKMAPKVVGETQVQGRRALWTEGPYLLVSRHGDWQQRRLLQGHVLIWTVGALTYRLETALPLAEAVKIAESLQ